MPRDFTWATDDIVGENVRRLRRAQGKTNEQLRTLLQVSKTEVVKYQNGTVRMHAGQLYAIAEWLRLPVEAFYEGVPERERPIARPLAADLRLTEIYRLGLAINNKDDRAAFQHLVRTVAKKSGGRVHRG